jgi:hypothetical protein
MRTVSTQAAAAAVVCPPFELVLSLSLTMIALQPETLRGCSCGMVLWNNCMPDHQGGPDALHELKWIHGVVLQSWHKTPQCFVRRKDLSAIAG